VPLSGKSIPRTCAIASPITAIACLPRRRRSSPRENSPPRCNWQFRVQLRVRIARWRALPESIRRAQCREYGRRRRTPRPGYDARARRSRMRPAAPDVIQRRAHHFAAAVEDECRGARDAAVGGRHRGRAFRMTLRGDIGDRRIWDRSRASASRARRPPGSPDTRARCKRQRSGTIRS